MATGLDFSQALIELRVGRRVAREAWRLTSLLYVPGRRVVVDPEQPLGAALPYLAGQVTRELPRIDVFYERRLTLAPWTPTVADLLALDWWVLPRP